MKKNQKVDGRTINKLQKFQAPAAKQAGKAKAVRLTKAGLPDKRYLTHLERQEVTTRERIYHKLKGMSLSKMEQLLVKIA